MIQYFPDQSPAKARDISKANSLYLLIDLVLISRGALANDSEQGAENRSCIAVKFRYEEKLHTQAC